MTTELRTQTQGRHALAIRPGLTHYNLGASPLFATTALSFLDQ